MDCPANCTTPLQASTLLPGRMPGTRKNAASPHRRRRGSPPSSSQVPKEAGSAAATRDSSLVRDAHPSQDSYSTCVLRVWLRGFRGCVVTAGLDLLALPFCRCCAAAAAAGLTWRIGSRTCHVDGWPASIRPCWPAVNSSPWSHVMCPPEDWKG